MILALVVAGAALAPLPGSSARPSEAWPDCWLSSGYSNVHRRDRGPWWSPAGDKLAVLEGARVVVVDVRTRRRAVVLDSEVKGVHWAPRGKLLAAFTDSDIYVGAPPRQLRRITRGCFGAWHPSGRRFAFSVAGSARTVNADGSQSRRLTPAYMVTDWSSDGRRLLVLRFIARGCGAAMRVHVFRFDTRRAQLVSGDRVPTEYGERERGYQYDAQFSPDGRRASWLEDLPCDIVGSEYERSVHITGQSWRIGRGRATWSPSSQVIALERFWNESAAIVDVRSGVVRELPSTVDVSWSPGGKRIAFDQGMEVYVAPALRPDRRRLLASFGYGPAWSPDGSKIAFWGGGGGSRCAGGLFVVRAQGGAPRKLFGC